MTRVVKFGGMLAVAALVTTISAVGASGQTTTTPGGAGSVANYGPTTDGNAKAAKAVKAAPLTGASGSGLTRGVSATAIKIGCYLQQASFPGAAVGFKARFDRANKAGEIPGGRKIEMVDCRDDGSNPLTNLQLIQTLVQRDQVFAIVGISANVLPESADFMNTNQVPYLGWGFLPGFCHTRWGFGLNGCLITAPTDKPQVYQGSSAGAPIKAAALQPKQARVALQAGEDEAGRSAVTTIGESYKLLGAKVVFSAANVPVSAPPPSFSPFVNAIVAAKPNILHTLLNSQTAPGLTGAMTAAGFTGTNVNLVAYLPGLLASSPQVTQAYNGALVSSQIVPQEAQTAYIKQMELDLVASGASTGRFITLAIALAYAQADVLVSMLMATGSDLDTKTFDQTINRGKYVYRSSVDGGPGQMSFPAMHHIAADCAAVLRINGPAAAYTPVVPFTCYDSLVVKPAKRGSPG